MEQREKLTLERVIIFGYRVDALKTFYVDNFNLEVTEEINGEWIVLNAGQVEIAIHKVGKGFEPKTDKAFRFGGNTKLVFNLADNLPAFRERLLNNGVAMKEIKSFEGINSLFCDGEDPEGNVFQIEQRLD